MKSITTIISDYLEECRKVFNLELKFDSNIIPFPGIEHYREYGKSLLGKAIIKVEKSTKFNIFAEQLDNEILKNDLDRLIKEKKINL